MIISTFLSKFYKNLQNKTSKPKNLGKYLSSYLLNIIIILALSLSFFGTPIFETSVEAQDPKVELNTYVDPIKDLGIKPLLATIKFDKEQSTEEVNNIISQVEDVEVKELKQKSKVLKRIKKESKKENNKESKRIEIENNAKTDEVVLGLNNIEEITKIAKKTNKKIKNIKKESDIDISTKANKDIEVMDLTPLINDMYPSRQAIDNLNREILAEAKFEKEHLKKMKHLKEPKAPTQDLKSMFLEGVKAQADSNTSGEASNLLIYTRMNQGLTLDVPGSGFRQGQQLQLWDRWTNYNPSQNFKTHISGPAINVTSAPHLCLHRQNGSYNAGTPVVLWTCNGSEAQHWQVHHDGTIRPLRNYSKCLDAFSGLTRGSKIVIQDCHLRDNQNFRMGQNEDFGSTRTYEMSIHAASATPDSLRAGVPFNFGHAFISVSKNFQVTNTFGSNGPNEEAKDKNSRGNFADGRTNNIHTWNTLNVDGDAEDWPAANGQRAGYVKRTVKIPKSTYDTIKYMRGWDFDESFKTYSIKPPGKHCATYAFFFWNKYVWESSNITPMPTGIFGLVTPASIATNITILGSKGY